MGNSHPQTNRSPSERAKTQSAQSFGKNSIRPAYGDEPAELKDVNHRATDADGDLAPEEQEIDRRLEAKVGLGLVVLLAGAFGFMLWQKWTHRQPETYAQNDPKSITQQNGLDNSNANQPSIDLEQPEPKQTAQIDPFEQKLPIVQASEKKVVHPLLDSKTTQDQLSQSEPEPSIAEKLDQNDPFGSETLSNKVVDKPKSSPAADPFGDEWAGNPKPAEKPDELPVLEIGTIANENNKPSTIAQENPFGEKSQPKPELTTETPEGDPFAERESKSPANAEGNQELPAQSLEFADGPTLTPQTKQPVASAEEKFAEPLPVLERVPERSETGSKHSFGEFEVVPVGSSKAFSTTNVSAGEFPEQNDPFATTKAQPRELTPVFPKIHTGIESLRTYRIQENDTYWKISEMAYQTSRYYRALARYNQNRISDPTKMRLGQEILLPPERELELKYPELFPWLQGTAGAIVQTSGSGFLTDNLGTPQYRVGDHDTLSSIAQRHLGRASRWIQIYELNRKQIPDPNRLKIGTILTLPTDASNVRVIGERADATLR